MRKLGLQRRAATMVEYALLLGLISVVAIFAIRQTGTEVRCIFEDTAFALAQATGSGYQPSQECVTLLPEDLVYSFEFASSTVGEDEDVTLRIFRRVAYLNGFLVADFPSDVDLVLTPGTATDSTDLPPDYTDVSGVVSFPAGSSETTVTIPVLDDAIIEGDEQFTASLDIAVGTPGEFTTHTATISGASPGTGDDDAGNVLVNFSQTSLTGSEGTTVSIVVTRDIGAAADIEMETSFDLLCLAGTAGFTDYTCPPGPFTFGPNQTSLTIDIVLEDDDILEGDEDLSIEITNVVGAGAPGPDSAGDITITDADAIAANVSLVVGDASVLDGADMAATVPVSVQLSPGLTYEGGPVTFDVTMADGSEPASLVFNGAPPAASVTLDAGDIETGSAVDASFTRNPDSIIAVDLGFTVTASATIAGVPVSDTGTVTVEHDGLITPNGGQSLFAKIDVNEDGIDDWWTAVENGNNSSILHRLSGSVVYGLAADTIERRTITTDGTDAVSFSHAGAVGGSNGSFAPVDSNNDGRIDFVGIGSFNYPTGNGTPGVADEGDLFLTDFRPPDGAASYSAPQSVPFFGFEGQRTHYALGDVNGDGFDDRGYTNDDLVGGGGAFFPSSSVMILGNVGSAGMTNVTRRVGGIHPLRGDFNGDGFGEFALDNKLYQWNGSSAGATGLSGAGLPGGGARDAGDVNGDNQPDLFVRSGADSYVVIDGSSFFAGISGMDGTTGFVITGFAIEDTDGDANGDGIDDLFGYIDGRMAVITGRNIWPATIDAAAEIAAGNGKYILRGVTGRASASSLFDRNSDGRAELALPGRIISLDRL